MSAINQTEKEVKEVEKSCRNAKSQRCCRAVEKSKLRQGAQGGGKVDKSTITREVTLEAQSTCFIFCDGAAFEKEKKGSLPKQFVFRGQD